MIIPHLLLEGKLLVSLTFREYQEYNGSLIPDKRESSLLHILINHETQKTRETACTPTQKIIIRETN